ncbi:MAG: Rod shape-determining protein mreB [Candidatus Nomurabacteria bacterium GW2011_GWA1_46_11]|uniref:Cell shape-determining protein MreB n=1 Tax=Candidatus Nomurabacteria bacterium GW2011_GWA1_46_11 TaxID=1618732 RepID=A0A0G1RLX3_9BACT|nr:MAG: Rod shape-determining protein mreB [Microgenomates group bacterium GW2011_GWA2_44_7]KKT77690.1 MAG: Rod shape-determining protein mreB [Microgenomates group bacterium GW2011_GWB1_44_8]KKU21935.1 MAG: Rod shape-determining protein mreB [Candidatus Nomurabacteria bacterium GW2011_GWA1_46_11]
MLYFEPMFDSVWNLLSYEVGIDLGTANVLVLVKGKGIVIREPSVVARHKKTKQLLAIGAEAKKMLGKAPPTIEVIRPLKDGVIADFDATEVMLKYFINKVHESGRIIPKIPHPRVVIGIPSGVTEVERRAVQEAAFSAGARQAFLIEEPMAAAIGAGLPIAESTGTFIVDIGGGTTEIAVISLGGIVINRSIRVAGDEMDEAVTNFLRIKHSLLVGPTTAEDVKLSIGSAAIVTNSVNKNIKRQQEEGSSSETDETPPVINPHSVIRGRDLETGLPKSIKVSASEVREALAPIIQQIVTTIVDTLEETPPELISDILQKGIVMAGGGSLLPGMDKYVSEATKMPVWVADDPLTCVVRGCGRVLDDPKLLSRVRVVGGLK